VPEEYERWRTGILFGMIYFIEHNLITEGLKVIVKEIRYNDVDTNNTIISFITVNAIITALNVPVRKNISFNKESLEFIFPR
jgi:hypothetical protein